jgi:CHAD domain-containing protein
VVEGQRASKSWQGAGLHGEPARYSHVPARESERENVKDHQPDVLFPHNGQQTPEPCDSLSLRLHSALHGHWENYRKGFKHCRRKLSADAVHSLRVETRRLLSLLDLLQPLVDATLTQNARRRFKKVFRVFAQLRDTQVQLRAVKKDVRRPAEWREFQRTLRRRETKLICRIERRIKKAKLGKLKDSLEAVPKALRRSLNDERSGKARHELVIGAVDRAFAMTRQRQRLIDPLNPATIHQTRIAFKKFRYMVEALREILPGLVPDRSKEMQAYQTSMGRVQDAEVLLASVQTFHAKRKTDRAIVAAQHAELLQHRSRRIAQFLTVNENLLTFWSPRDKAVLASARQTRPSHA